MKKYEDASSFSARLAKEMTDNVGLIDHHFRGGYSQILNEIYLGTFSEKSVKDSVPNCKDITIDCEQLSIDIKSKILNSKEYIDFINSSNEISELMNELYEGLDYILMKIHKKYKGMNTLG